MHGTDVVERTFAMELGDTLDLAREGLLISLVIAGPILLTGVVIGLGISLVQTLTQLQDQTISTVPKIVAMFAAAIFFIPWVGSQIIEYSQRMFSGGFH